MTIHRPALRAQNTNLGRWWGLLVAIAAAVSPAPVAGADVDLFVLFKGRQYDQSSAGSPVPSQNAQPFGMNAFASLTSPNVVTNGSLRLPNGAVQPFTVTPNVLVLGQGFSSQSDLDTNFPSGAYTFNFDTVDDGAKAIVLNLTGDLYPPPPHLSNYSLLQNITATNAVALTWDAWTGGTTNDFVQVQVAGPSGIAFSTPGTPEAPGALNGTSVATTIPANTLAPGQTYQAYLLFTKVVARNTASYPGAFGLAAYSASTAAPLATTGAAPGADVSVYVLQKRQNFAQTDTGAPVPDSAPFQLESLVLASASNDVASAALRSPGGLSVNLTNAPDGRTWMFQSTAATAAALSVAFPAGNYGFTLATLHNGTRNLTLSLPADAYPPTPRLSDFAEAQSVDATGNFTLTWDSFIGATSNDVVQVTVEDPQIGQTLIQTPPPGDPSALAGFTTSIALPPQVLTAGHTYRVRIAFMHVIGIDVSSYPGAQGIILFSSQTTAPLVTVAGASTPDLVSFRLIKGQLYSQTNVGTATLQSGVPFLFDVSGEMSSVNTVTNGALRLPTGNTLPLSIQSGFLQNLENFTNQSDLDSARPDGSYTLTFDTVHDGIRASTLSLTNSAYPPVPHVSNYVAAQAVVAGSDFVLAWDPFDQGTAGDFVLVRVVDPQFGTVFSTGGPGAANALNGTATSVTIPAHTLSPGVNYQARLLFLKTTSLDTNSYPGVFGVAGYLRETDFTLGTASAVTGHDLATYSLTKSQQFLQTTTNTPLLRADSPFVFEANLVANATGTVAGATLQLPTGASLPFASSDLGLIFYFRSDYTNQATLEATFPNGAYRLSVFTVLNGTNNLLLSLPDDAYPPAPHVSNWTAAQSLDPMTNFTLTWDALPGTAATNTTVVLRILDPAGRLVFVTPQIGQPGSLDGTATGVTLPGHTLAGGLTYSATLLFEQATVDTSSYPGATGFAGRYVSTDFALRTVAPPVLLNPARTADGGFHLHLDTQPNQTYQLQTSTNLLDWVTVTNAAAGTNAALDYVDGQASAFRRRFYRAIRN